MFKSKTLILAFILCAGGHLFGQSSESLSYANGIEPAKFAQLYPNPTTDFINVRLDMPHAKSVKLAMHSVIGNALNVDSEVVDEYSIRIRVKDLPEGYYFLAIRDEEASFKSTYKFLKR